jgi:hypothetical protein
MNVLEIIEQWLSEHGYDGLCGEECGCEIGDLAPCCCEGLGNCIPGHKIPCDGQGDACESSVPCRWHMKPGPREEPTP